MGKLLFMGALIIAPFLALIRGSVFLHLSYALSPWVALALGAIMMFGLVFGYGIFFLSRWDKGLNYSKCIAVGIGIAIVCFAGYTAFFVSGANVKDIKIKTTYHTLHPLLRVAVGTLLLVDEGLVLTDLGRTRADYKKWKLSALENSYHYKQRDGYVHAVDIRTMGRSEVLNRLVQSYFWLMGFKTIRHVGTADHLHISLPLLS